MEISKIAVTTAIQAFIKCGRGKKTIIFYESIICLI